MAGMGRPLGHGTLPWRTTPVSIRCMGAGRRARLALAGAGIAAAVGGASVWLAFRSPALAIDAVSLPAAALSVLAGESLLAAGIWSWWRSPSSVVAPLAFSAGVTWFIADWTNPGTGIAPVFTAGLVLGAVAQAFIAHLVLSYPDGHVSGAPARWVVAAGYVVGLVGIGLIPTLLLAPSAAGCNQCPANLLVVVSAPRVAAEFLSASLLASSSIAISAALLGLDALRRSSPPARLVRAPVVVFGSIYLAAFATRALHDAPSGFLGLDNLDAAARTVESLALVGLSIGIAWKWARTRWVRGRVAALVVGLARARQPGGVRDVIAELVADPELVLAYPLGDGRYVDATGAAIARPERPGRRTTSLVRDGEAVAVLEHSASLSDDPSQLEVVVQTAYLAVENERLTALARARLEDIRVARRRVVAARDAERRRLERDLHDGAQQRLVALAIALRLEHARTSPSDAASDAHDGAEVEVLRAIEAVREIGHGIYPSLLAEEGLAVAVEALSEDSPVAYEVRSVVEGRFDSPVESAAYDLIAVAPVSAGATRVTVRMERSASSLLVMVGHDGDAAADVTALAERIAALGGSLLQSAGPAGLVVLEAELPCAS